MTYAIFSKEIQGYLKSPAGYLIISAYLFISGIMFTLGNLMTGSKDYAFTLSSSLFVLSLITPLITMRLYTEERREHTEALLYTQPIGIPAIVIGKFSSAALLFTLMVILTTIYPMILSRYGSIDLALLFTTYVGYLLVGYCFIAIGSLVSSISPTMGSAAVVTFTLLFSSWIIDFVTGVVPSGALAGYAFSLLLISLSMYWFYRASSHRTLSILLLISLLLLSTGLLLLRPESYTALLPKTLSILVLTRRFPRFALGILDLGAFLYYLAIITACLYVTGIRMAAKRWQP